MGDSFTLDVASGERAMLVKNADGDWGLVKGVWIPGKDATGWETHTTHTDHTQQ